MSDLGLTNHKGHPGKTLTLVTNNEADFVNYAGLPVENWVSNH